MASKKASGQNSGRSKGKPRGRPMPQNIEAHKWQPGQSGNPGGRPRTSIFRDALVRAITKLAKDKSGHQVELIDAIAQQLMAKAIKGDLAAIAMIADRTDGKPAQSVTVGGPDGGAIPITTLTPAENEKRIAEILAKTGAVHGSTTAD